MQVIPVATEVKLTQPGIEMGGGGAPAPYPGQAIAQPYMQNPADPVRDWPVGLFQIGHCGACLFACCFPQCALASARHNMDDSNWCVNCCCLSPAPARWMIRTGYNIGGGNAHWDCWVTMCCKPCAVNQMYQTTLQFGKASTTVGPQFNVNEREGWKNRACKDKCYDCFYSMVCNPCANGYVMQSVGMPFWFGCLLVNPVMALSILRYHHRIKPWANNDAWCDCFFPGVFLCAASMLNSFTMGASGPLLESAYTCFNLMEENHRANRTGCYGCDCPGFFSGCCGYCCSCRCPGEEGRYLVKGV